MNNHITGLPNRLSEFNEDIIINGSLTINNGSQGAGLVLTSDANGLVTFQTNSSASTVSCSVTGGTLSAGTLTLLNCSGGTAAIITGFSTGSTGSTSSGLAAYGYAVGQDSTTIGADSAVIFDLGATRFPNVGMTVPSPGGSGFTITTTGDYEFEFYVVSTTHAAFATTPLVFAIYRNGSIATVAGNAFEFRGTFTTTDANQSVRGQGIIALTAGDVITLHNRTNTVTDTVTVATTQTGVEASPNRTLSLKKLN